MTAEVVTIDGVEQSRTVVSTSVIKEPVNEVIAVGGKKYNDVSVAGDGKSHGAFVWPLPATKQISSYFGSRWGSTHGAIDISNGRVYGKPIIASDGGKVVEAGWHYSYGYYVLIDHGNGFKTRYAHCSKLNVKVGQRGPRANTSPTWAIPETATARICISRSSKTASWSTPLNYVNRYAASAPPGTGGAFSLFIRAVKSNWGPCHFRAQGVEWR